MTVCCPHNRCPDRPRWFLRRFRNRPWYCDQCGRLWVTVGHGVQHPDGGVWWEWKDLTVTEPQPKPSPVTVAPTAGEQTLTSKVLPTSLPVHDHGPEEGRGVACRERWVDGRLVGACLPDEPRGQP